jgi:hypothetical protein
MRRLKELVGVDRRTVARWRRWWRVLATDSPFWRSARAAFMPPVDEDRLPAALIERFFGSAAELTRPAPRTFVSRGRYGEAGFLAAYIAGPARGEDHLAIGRLLPDDPHADVGALARTIAGEQVDDSTMVAVTARSRTAAPLFAVRGENRSTDIPLASDPLTGRPSIDSAVADPTALIAQSDDLSVRSSHRNSQL